MKLLRLRNVLKDLELNNLKEPKDPEDKTDQKLRKAINLLWEYIYEIQDDLREERKEDE